MDYDEENMVKMKPRVNIARATQRTFATARLDPAIRDYVHKLAEYQPCFAMSSSNVKILRQPTQFYQQLLDMIRRARKRIFISSLYVGSEEVELVETLRTALHTNQSLQLHMQLDLNRSTRPGPGSTAFLLLPLLKEYPDRVHISLFRSPNLKGIMAKLVPPRYNEGWGTWHPKIYGVDDEVMISGANLNESYFSNRQDRYIHLASQPHFAQYCFDFLQSSAGFSYRLLPPTDPSEPYHLHWPDERVHPHHTEAKAENTLTKFQDVYRLSSTFRISEGVELGEGSDTDVLVFPILQAGQFKVREEERALSLLFDELAQHQETPRGEGDGAQYGGPLLDMTTGYFGLYRPYRDLVLQSPVGCRILCSAPKANGFYGSRGPSGRLPEGYTLMEQRFMKAVRDARREWIPPQPGGGQRHPGVQLREWEKEGWTYHAKGLWLRPSPQSNPYLTLFGSTNLNSRSATLDTELSFIMVTTSEALQQRLGEEVDGLRDHSRAWQGGERHVRIGTKFLVSVMGGML
ncbi:hypothetical protein BXZ70DRAFT_997834 [Cristinia sonorae]|uniref:CDP-diacylglycerol--glycerol-3-phosphate 3-phosphatidyltransferase n=1 Tax=Cristinia sonorae TaxID=1940300 RepID=A0A8K0UYJ2_9AGAR|nr:hypothetical protein BXZ70DRAFT_997834 [Cristinia sonorae]